MSRKLYAVKMHGCGNSQLVVEGDEFYKVMADPSKTSKTDFYSMLALGLCSEQFGIGADQMLVSEKSQVADFKMRTFNKNGSEAKMCGNGIRCFAINSYKFLGNEEMTIETPFHKGNEIKTVRVNSKKNSVTVDMGVGRYLDRKVIDFINRDCGVYDGYVVDVGNPHFVVFDDDASRDMANDLGPCLEKHQTFQPDKINVEFVRVNSPTSANMFVWERENGETYACGTGACATAFAGYTAGLLDANTIIKLLGGELEILIDENDRIQMTGPAQRVCNIVIDSDDLEKAIINNVIIESI